MVFGTFDIFHEGHKNFLKQARKYWMPPRIGVRGDKKVRHDKVYLVAVVARDKTVLEVKGKLSKNNEKKRLMVVKKSGLADEVVLGRINDKYALIKKYKPDIICLGYDQKYFVSGLKKKIKKFNLKTKIKQLKPYKPSIYKSSRLQ